MHRCLKWAYFSSLSLGALHASGCGAPEQKPPDPTGEAREEDRIANFERPETLVVGASRRLADVIDASDVGQEFGAPDERVPYADTYWPFVLGGADTPWNPRGRDPRTPLEKYMTITNPWETDSAREWEFFNHGPGEPGVQPWHGHCFGWTGAAMSNAPILHAVLAGSDGRGGIAPCREGTSGCVRFEIGDVNALMAEIYFDGQAATIGTTCGVSPGYIPHDQYGRVLRQGCDGVNAGSFLVATSTLLKRYHTPFAIDLQKPASTDEIWNQPAYRYHVYDYHPITEKAASNLVTHGSESGAYTGYPWDPAARGFAFVDMGLRFVGESGPNISLVPGTRSTYEMRVVAVIELDADPSNPAATILGGEYLDYPASHAARLKVAPFLWRSLGPGPEYLSPWASSTHHNPYVRPSLVAQLVRLGQQ